MPLPTTEQIEKAKLHAEQARARYQALQARLSEAARKLDTRRKIILGGLLLDAAERDEKFARVVHVLVGRVSRDQDAKAFEGWEPPKPSAADRSQPALASLDGITAPLPNVGNDTLASSGQPATSNVRFPTQP